MVAASLVCLFILTVLLSFFINAQSKLPGMLYPRDSESRTLRKLDGMWNFRIDDSPARNESFVNKWFMNWLDKTGDVIQMPVPSSYNDITTNKSIRDFVGWAWYDRGFYVDSEWNSTRRVVLRIDSAHYYSIVWVNGREVVRHDGGHLPFEAEVSPYLNFNDINRVTVAVNNTLTPTTLPPGTIEYKKDTNRYPAGYFVQNLNFDFYNYAGIHRHVTLYTTPFIFVEDITIVSDIVGTKGVVNYVVSSGGPPGFIGMVVEILDRDGISVGSSTKAQDTISIPNAKFWWPYTMNKGSPGYLYTLKVSLRSTGNPTTTDVYRQPFGIRTVSVSNTQIFINSRPFYCHGVAKHEDSDIRGKGLDYPLIARDFNMLKWLGVNCFRTSHYPYAEEIMDQADQQGIVVIDESPGVGIGKDNFGNKSLTHHLEVMGEMVQRDKNRPAVIMWSVANEPKSADLLAGPYFKAVIYHVRTLDPTRPITFVSAKDYNNDLAVQYVDVICVNRYYAWYSDCGHTEVIQKQLEYDMRGWHTTFNKPVIITEYGADTVAGLHQDPSFVFTEEFQNDFLTEYHKVFDKLRTEFLVGEMVWNFADFMTVQQITRVVGNRKGLLTRQRQPKMAAHLIRDRYMSLMTGQQYCRL